MQENEPQARITCGSLVVHNQTFRTHTGLDFLKVTFWLDWNNDEFLNLLSAAKSALQETEDASAPFTTKWKSLEWNLHRTGTTLFNFRLTSGDVTLLLNKRQGNSPIPSCRLEIGSLSSQSICQQVYDNVLSWLKTHGALVIKATVSEVHLATDFIGLNIQGLGIQDDGRWVLRHPDFETHSKYRKLTGIDIGKGNLMLRIYDKVRELRRSGHKQEFFSELWKTETFDEQDVTRVEFQLRRPVLRQFRGDKGEEINTFAEVIGALNTLWHYCTHNWAKFMDDQVNRNHNQSKSTCDEFWLAVQGVTWQGLTKLERCKQTPHKDEEAMRKQLRGLAMSIAAFCNVQPDDIETICEVTLALLNTELIQFFKNKNAEFIKRMQRKILEVFASPDFGGVPF